MLKKSMQKELSFREKLQDELKEEFEEESFVPLDEVIDMLGKIENALDDVIGFIQEGDIKSAESAIWDIYEKI